MHVNKNQCPAPAINEQKTFVFKKLEQPVRIELIDGSAWFAAKDVCRILDIKNHKDAVGKLDADERRGSVLPTPSGKQTVTLINESGLYFLIFQSRKPEAKAFRRWVTGEVLPQIRQTGGYAKLPKMRYVTLNGRKMYPFRQLCQKLFGTPGGNYYRYKRRYAGLFAEFDGISYCSEEVGWMLMLNKSVRAYREDLKNVPPVLPLDFGQLLFPMALNAAEKEINSETGKRNILNLGRKK